MTLFLFEAMDAHGKKHKGELDVASERLARAQLKGNGWVVRKLTTLSEPIVDRSRSDAGVRKGAKLSITETSQFLQQLSILVQAGMPLAQALDTIVEGFEQRKSKRVIVALRQCVLEGGSLSQGLRQQGFEEVICNMVAAGEETGQLDQVASRLAELFERRQQLDQDLLSATLYPALILTAGVGVMMFLLAVVVPQIVTVFERTGGELPLLTQVVLGMSKFVQHDALWMILTLVMVIVLYRLAMRSDDVHFRRDQLLLRIPAVSTLLVRMDMARFSRTLGMLLTGGVPVLAAMHIAVQSLSMRPIQAIAMDGRELLREGESLAHALKAGGYIPHMALRMIAVGEQSGRLDQMLLQIAENYERESTRAMKRLLTILEPTLVIIMAALVGLLAMAILLPIVEMNQLVH
ncbi:MAG: type II secretion system F family protein [Zetaproteobacteria bacterium]|nr:type II secretion system F family protein [Zetaproteobacteria bacterium]